MQAGTCKYSGGFICGSTGCHEDPVTQIEWLDPVPHLSVGLCDGLSSGLCVAALAECLGQSLRGSVEGSFQQIGSRGIGSACVSRGDTYRPTHPWILGTVAVHVGVVSHPWTGARSLFISLDWGVDLTWAEAEDDPDPLAMAWARAEAEADPPPEAPAYAWALARADACCFRSREAAQGGGQKGGGFVSQIVGEVCLAHKHRSAG